MILLRLLVAAMCWTACCALAQSLSLSLGNLEGPNWQARDVRVALNLGGASQVQIGQLDAFGRSYTKLSLSCKKLLMERDVTHCKDGTLEAPEKVPVEFVYSAAKRSLKLSLAPAAGEAWEVDLSTERSLISLQNAELTRVATWLPGDFKPTAGRVSGMLALGPLEAHADLRLTDAGFTDTDGLHAGEKLAGRLKIDAKRARPTDAWVWDLDASWDAGAVFWDPIYISNSGHTIRASGEFQNDLVTAKNVVAAWPHLGEVKSDFTMEMKTKRFTRFNVTGQNLKLTALRELIPQDWLEKHDLADLALAGSADLELRQSGESIERLKLSVADAGLSATARKLSMHGLTLLIDYDTTKPGPLDLKIEQVRLRDLSAGPITASGEFRDGQLTIPSILIPLLDGVVVFNDIVLARDAQGEVAGELRGAFTPIAMDQLTTGLGLLEMNGTISAVIPKMTYAKSTLKVDGALLFKVFGGDASVDEIRLENPFGRTPRLTADLRLKNMDLELMTGEVKFGNITGKIDVEVIDLELENWQPLSFNAKVLTSPGDFKKRISQKAVQNISSIGGAGAGAAIQASFLSVFSSFGYDKIGLSCKLVNGICELGGVEDAAQGFVMIKGGGLPAVNVVGYNRRVGWDELLARIKAVIDGNSKMVIQ
jgi:hypothetical protein